MPVKPKRFEVTQRMFSIIIFDYCNKNNDGWTHSQKTTHTRTHKTNIVIIKFKKMTCLLNTDKK